MCHIGIGVPKMVQIYKGGGKLDALATRTSMRALRTLFNSTPRGMSSSELAGALATSRSSIQRSLVRLDHLGLVQSREGGRLVLYSIDSASPFIGPLFEMFNHERYQGVLSRTRTVLERIMLGIDTSDLTCVILFGSQAKGTAGRKSDIDLCFVWRNGTWDDGFQPLVRELAFPYILVEPHCYGEDDFMSIPDLVVLDAVLFGISLHGHHFLGSTRHGLRTIRKEVLLARLEGCRTNLSRAAQVIGEAREHFEAIVEVGLAEIEAVVREGVTVSRAEIEPQGDLEGRIERLNRELAREGNELWVT